MSNDQVQTPESNGSEFKEGSSPSSGVEKAPQGVKHYLAPGGHSVHPNLSRNTVSQFYEASKNILRIAGDEA
jgi:hypothetical protein